MNCNKVAVELGWLTQSFIAPWLPAAGRDGPAGEAGLEELLDKREG